MAAVPSPHTDSVRAALVYQAVALSDALKTALAGAGVQIVVEVRADAIDRTALNSAAVQVFVINLDPDLEDHLDELTEVLDGFSRPVIFNDASASSSLSGWDQARWARHLGAKIKGEVDAHPPRPEGATFIPPPERKIVQIAAPRVVPGPAAEPVAATAVPVAAPAPAAPAPVLAAVAAAPAPAPVPAVQAPPVRPAPTVELPVPPAQSKPAAVPSPAAAPVAESSGFDIDALFADLSPEPTKAAATPAAGDGFWNPAGEAASSADMSFDFDLKPAVSSEPAEAVADFAFAELNDTQDAGSADLSALWDEPLASEAPTAETGFAGFNQYNSDFDEAALDDPELAAFEMPAAPPLPAADELTDLDALFRELAPAPDANPSVPAAAAAAPASAKPAPAAPRAAEAPRKVAELKAPPMDWSLEPLDGEGLAQAPAPAPAGRAQFKVGQDATPVLPPVAPVKAPVAAAAPAAEADTELAAFDFFFEPSGAPAPAPVNTAPAISKVRPALDVSEIPDFGFALEPLDLPEEAPAPLTRAPQPPAPTPVAAPKPTAPAPVPAAAAPRPVAPPPAAPRPAAVAPAPVAPVVAKAPAAPSPPPAQPGDELAAFDFNFDNFDNFDAPASGRSASRSSMEAAALADLDGLFADIEAPPVISDVPNLDRVWILGASIGGPEAVRSFLVGLRKQVASAFILAQHMGSEFLDLMISQLAKASPLPVKVAQAGDKLQNGQVLVAPVGKRLTVDAQGRVVLGETSSDMPYSPSIDQIMFDMADRFGPRCSAVIFSGMASDAIEGAKYIASKGGRIWVQDPSTCVISSMIDGAQAAGVVSYVGSPEQLAEHLQAHLS